MGFDNESILNIHSVVPEYFCPVCRTLVYPNEALQTPCSHLFCKPCLVHIASSTQACPYDGYLVTEAGSKTVVEINKTLAETIGKVAVRCVYHMSGCMWQGSLSECIVHLSGCAFGDSPVICIRCQIQIPHRQAEEHAQICNVNLVMNPQPQQGPQNAWDGATSGAAVSSDQSKAAIQAGVPTSHPPAFQITPAKNLNQPAIANPQPQALPVIVMSTSQWSQPQYQQYYEQYPVCNAYQQVYPQMYPYSLQATQPSLQVQGLAQNQAHAQLQPQSQVLLQQQVQPPTHVEPQAYIQPLPQAQAEFHSLTQVPGQPRHQSQLQAQPQFSFFGPHEPHMYPQAAMPGSNQNQAQHNPQQQIQPQPQFQPQPLQQPMPQQYVSSLEPQYPGLQRPYSQSQSPPYGPTGFVSSSAPMHCYEQSRTSIGKHPDAFQMEPSRHLDQGFHQHFVGDSSATMPARPFMGGPGFQSSYTCQGFPNAGQFCAGGSDSFDNLRKRKSTSMGWCRICKVDCESLQGLKRHGQTREHQQMAMDMVNNIKQKSARIANCRTSNARSGLGEASKLGSAVSRGCSSKP